MSLENLKALCAMIKVSPYFAEESHKYFQEMKDLFKVIPTNVKENHASDMIRNLGSVDDQENLKFSDSDILGSTNIVGNYFKSKRSVAHD